MTILLEYSIDHKNVGGSFHYYGDSDAVDRIKKLKSTLKSSGEKIDQINGANEEKEKIHMEMENQNQAILEKLYFDIDHNEVSNCFYFIFLII